MIYQWGANQGADPVSIIINLLFFLLIAKEYVKYVIQIAQFSFLIDPILSIRFNIYIILYNHSLTNLKP